MIELECVIGEDLLYSVSLVTVSNRQTLKGAHRTKHHPMSKQRVGRKKQAFPEPMGQPTSLEEARFVTLGGQDAGIHTLTELVFFFGSRNDTYL